MLFEHVSMQRSRFPRFPRVIAPPASLHMFIAKRRKNGHVDSDGVSWVVACSSLEHTKTVHMPMRGQTNSIEKAPCPAPAFLGPLKVCPHLPNNHVSGSGSDLFDRCGGQTSVPSESCTQRSGSDTLASRQQVRCIH